jgi:hypothetical protein
MEMPGKNIYLTLFLAHNKCRSEAVERKWAIPSLMKDVSTSSHGIGNVERSTAG